MVASATKPDATLSRDRLLEILDRHIVSVAIVLYALLCVPVFLWLEGPVGIAGTVEDSVVILSLALGGILFVPALMIWLRRKKFDLGYASTEQ